MATFDYSAIFEYCISRWIEKEYRGLLEKPEIKKSVVLQQNIKIAYKYTVLEKDYAYFFEFKQALLKCM